MTQDSNTPMSGDILDSEGNVRNLVTMLGGKHPVSDTVYDRSAFAPRSGLILGEDGKAYDLVSLIEHGGTDIVSAKMLSFDGLEVLHTQEQEVSDMTYKHIAELPASAVDAFPEQPPTVLFRMSIIDTETGGEKIKAQLDCMIQYNAPNIAPQVLCNYRTLSIGSTTTGLRYLRVSYPTSANGYGYGIEFSSPNNTPRMIRVDWFRMADGLQIRDAFVDSPYNSSRQSVSTVSLYTTRGLYWSGTMYGTANTANSASYISSYLQHFIGGTVEKTKSNGAILANQLVYLSTDGYYCPSTDKTSCIDPMQGIQLAGNAVAKNTAVTATYMRDRTAVTTLANITHDPFTYGTSNSKLYFRCTMDEEGNLHSDNYVATAMEPGFTWYPIGTASSTTSFKFTNHNSAFYTLDDAGKLTHINGIPLAR